jgi:ribonucleoside-diphosphate reductase subunit M1
MYLRVAIFLHMPLSPYDDPDTILSTDTVNDSLKKIKTVYDDMSLGRYTPASPTLFNAGHKNHQMASCFLLNQDDSLDSITQGWTRTAFISKNSGGIGKNYSNLRHSEIGNTGRSSKGVIPWLIIEKDMLKAVDQGGKRNGSGTMFLKWCHVDIWDFLQLKKKGPEDLRAHELFYCVVINDLFMKRIRENKMVSLFCPHNVGGILNTWGVEFEMNYKIAEEKGQYEK